MITLVCGGRDFLDREYVFTSLDRVDLEHCISGIVEGGQRRYHGKQIIGGADGLAFLWATERGVPCSTEEADWTRWGRAAGPMRNGAMLRIWRPQLLVHFPGGGGTADMIAQAKAAGIEIVDPAAITGSIAA